MKSVAIMTLGCKLNQYETMGMVEVLANRGYIIIKPEEGADIYIVNTCTVTGKTDRRSRQAVRRILNWNPAAAIVVTGCGVQRDPEEFRYLPNVVLLAGNREKHQITELIDSLESNQTQIRISDITTAPFESIHIEKFGSYTRAFLKIQDGCNGNCSYCVIPSVRGPSRSQRPDLIMNQIRDLTANGFRELVLTGIDLGNYGTDLSTGIDLFRLLKMIIAEESLNRVRLSSIEPTEQLKAIADLIDETPKICKHLHIPMQSGSDSILRLMNRSYTTEFYSDLVLSIKDKCSDICIGADVIVGFPGETEGLFKETYDFIDKLPLDYLHVFSFSERSGTPANSFKGKLDPETKKFRCHSLRKLSKHKASEFRQKMIGKELDVIVLGTKDKETGLSVGLSDNYIKVFIENTCPESGLIRKIKITRVQDLMTWGRM